MYQYDCYEGDYLPYTHRPSSPIPLFPYYIPAVELPPEMTDLLLSLLAQERWETLLGGCQPPHSPYSEDNPFLSLCQLAEELLENFLEELATSPDAPHLADSDRGPLLFAMGFPICPAASSEASQSPDSVPQPCPDSNTPICPAKPDSFAAFFNFACKFVDATLIPLVPSVTDPTEKILLTDCQHISLEPGYYHLSYHVSTLLTTPGFMQVTPAYNGTSHMEHGIYFRTDGQGNSAFGSHSFILRLPAKTELSLSFHTNTIPSGGSVSLTILRLDGAI